MSERRVPMRQCLGCREMKPKHKLLRVVRTADDNAVLDIKGRISGRGAYLCSALCLVKSVKTRSLERALGVAVSQDIYDNLKAELEENT